MSGKMKDNLYGTFQGPKWWPLKVGGPVQPNTSNMPQAGPDRYTDEIFILSCAFVYICSAESHKAFVQQCTVETNYYNYLSFIHIVKQRI